MGLNQSGSNLDDLMGAVPSILGALTQGSDTGGDRTSDIGANFNLSKIMEYLPAISSALPSIMALLNNSDGSGRSDLLTNLHASLPALTNSLTEAGVDLDNDQISQLLAMAQDLLKNSNNLK